MNDKRLPLLLPEELGRYPRPAPSPPSRRKNIAMTGRTASDPMLRRSLAVGEGVMRHRRGGLPAFSSTAAAAATSSLPGRLGSFVQFLIPPRLLPSTYRPDVERTEAADAGGGSILTTPCCSFRFRTLIGGVALLGLFLLDGLSLLLLGTSASASASASAVSLSVLLPLALPHCCRLGIRMAGVEQMSREVTVPTATGAVASVA
mmetsp:Transcript_19252/g.42742  ORF Transcript_19252/g.42742 Transcript_19252/m.42742 type:complete len:204 (-) Transcript_19252:13-624(-)